MHDARHRDRDIGGKNVLISTEFYYFGQEAISIPAEFSEIVATTQGHRNTYDINIINRFWAWLERTASAHGRLGEPLAFKEDRCRLPQIWRGQKRTCT
jgi:hypothetical protein